jgi:hypothetical protein
LQKLFYYILFRKVVILMLNKEHLNKDGLQKIVNIRASINKGLSAKLKAAFPDTVAYPKPDYKIDYSNLPAQWISGFTSGDGHFGVQILNKTTSKIGGNVKLVYVVSQNSIDENLLNSLVFYFGCGHLSPYNLLNDSFTYRCTNFNEINDIIIPFFIKNPILGVKALDFNDFTKVAQIFERKEHLTKNGLAEIK